MPVTVDTEFHLPPASAGPAFSTDAGVALGGDARWRDLQRSVLAALVALSQEHGCDAVSWFCTLGGPDENDATPRLGVLFTWDGPTSGAHSATLARALGDAWQREGVRAIPRRAFPSVAMKEGFPYQLWVEGRHGVNAPYLVVDEGELLQARLFAAQAEPDAFVGDALHAVAVVAAEEEDAGDTLEAVKVVFALNVCERIIEADGVLADAEIEFLRRVFPMRRLESLGLDDRVRFLMINQHAAADLARALSHDDKLSLMGLFWRAGQSDGFVDGAELQIVQEAAAQLQLEWSEVETYLRNMW